MRITALTGDITRIEADAIVNAANSSLLGGGGVDGAIHRGGGSEILEECQRLRETRLPDGLPTGDAVATTAGTLPARHVIHTVGPVHGRDAAELLDRCYTRSLQVADELSARSVTFPLISAGAYGWPKEDALRRALRAFSTTDVALAEAALVLFDPADLDLARKIADRDGVVIESGLR